MTAKLYSADVGTHMRDETLIVIAESKEEAQAKMKALKNDVALVHIEEQGESMVAWCPCEACDE